MRLCGALVVASGERELELPGRQGRVVLAYLALARPRAARRDELIEALWPGGAPATAEATLTSVLSRLRRVLPEGVLTGRGQLSLNVDWVDIEAAERAEDPRAAEALRDSLGLALETGIDDIDEVLLALAAHAVISGDLERAARLAGAGRAYEPGSLRHYELRVNDLLEAEYLALGRERLGAARWDELAAEGARLGREEAIALGR